MRPRTPCLVARAALAIAVGGLAVWRMACVGAAPDVDTDAYAHHMIARAILADPRDLGVHWVWLPLFHYLQVPLVAAGGTIDTVRYVNVALAAALPIVLYVYVRTTTARPASGAALSRVAPCVVALLAALFAAASPIVMQMGTTAQPEPLFALVMLGVAIAFETRRHAWAAALLGAGVLLRYEAWASLAAVAAVLSLDAVRALRAGRSPPRTAEALGPVAVVAVPVALILAWAALRRPVDGRWFGFLGQTREFATAATHEHTALDRGVGGLLHDALYYPVLVPARVLGTVPGFPAPALLLAPFGVARTVRRQGGRFVVVLTACLAFVSLTWIMRSSLGLDRHFVVVVPLYAAFAAHGVAALTDAAGAFAARFASRTGASAAAPAASAPRAAAVASERGPRLVATAIGAVVSVASFAALAAGLVVWMAQWRASIAFGWPDRAAVGAYLRTLPSSARIFCDDATVEILSGLDRERFDRHWMDDAATWDLVREAARVDGTAYVATWSRKLQGRGGAGDVVFRSGRVDDDPTSGLAVVRVRPDASRAGR